MMNTAILCNFLLLFSIKTVLSDNSIAPDQGEISSHAATPFLSRMNGPLRAAGKISQDLYARGLPPGVTMQIVDVDFRLPPKGDWYAEFGGHAKMITAETSEENKKRILPFEVTRDRRDGFIGSVYLGSTSLFDTGPGPEAYLTFLLHGTTAVNGTSITLNNINGRITVSSTKWSYDRPDYCNVGYQILGLHIRILPNPLPVLQSPKDVSFVFAANPEEEKVGVDASIDPDVTKDLIGYALKGIFFAHEKAAGWVVGKI